MRNLFFIAALLCASVNIASAQVVAHDNAERDLKTVQDARSAYLKGDWAALQALLTPNAMAYGVAGRDSLTGTELIQYWKTEREPGVTVALGKGPVLPLNMADGPQKGDWVFEWNQHTTTKDGKKVVFPFHLVYSMKEGKIARLFYYYNEAAIMKQEGWKFTPPNK